MQPIEYLHIPWFRFQALIEPCCKPRASRGLDRGALTYNSRLYSRSEFDARGLISSFASNTRQQRWQPPAKHAVEPYRKSMGYPRLLH